MQESTEIFNQCLCVEEFITSFLVQGHCQKGDSHYCILEQIIVIIKSLRHKSLLDGKGLEKSSNKNLGRLLDCKKKL